MECKVVINYDGTIIKGRINRNIVECKVFFVKIFVEILCSINRNIVECKEMLPCLFPCPELSVLIETLWNVKMLEGKLVAIPKYEY